MFANIVTGIKVDQDHGRLLDLVRTAAAPDAKIHLVTLVRVGKDGDEPRRRTRAEAELERIAGPLRSAGYDVSTEVELIAVAAGHEILRIAEEREADLIAIGLGKRTRVGKALLGSDAQSVIIGAGCAVLSIHIDA